MATFTSPSPSPFAPILSWDQVREALAHVTTPESKLALIPAIIADLQSTANPRTFALTLAVQISLLADPGYDIEGRAMS